MDSLAAQALVCDADESVTVERVELAAPRDVDVVVDTQFSGVSIGTELDVIRGTQGFGRYPLTTGYQAVGVIETVGEGVTAFDAGDRVYFRDTVPASLPDGTEVTPNHGTHCSRAVVDTEESHGIARIPGGVDAAVASTFVLPAVGLNGVDRAGVGMGDVVAVQGVGLVGLGVVAACVHRGARVVAIDPLSNRRDVARELGADHTLDPTTSDVIERVRRITDGGADVVFEATGMTELLDTAFELARTRGKFVFQGVYQDGPVEFEYGIPHGKRLDAFFPCDDGLRPCRRAVLKNMANGVLQWEKTLTHRVDPHDAGDLYADLLAGRTDDVLGAAVDWRNAG